MIDDVRRSVVAELARMEYDVSAVTGRTALGREGLELDSMAVAELAVTMESAFGVNLEELELDRLAAMTVDELAAEVALRVQESTAP